jgi:hypothetical protein
MIVDKQGHNLVFKKSELEIKKSIKGNKYLIRLPSGKNLKTEHVENSDDSF